MASWIKWHSPWNSACVSEVLKRLRSCWKGEQINAQAWGEGRGLVLALARAGTMWCGLVWLRYVGGFLTTELTGASSHRTVFIMDPAVFGSSVLHDSTSALLCYTEDSPALWAKLFTHHGAWLWPGSWSGLRAVAAVRCRKRHSCLSDPALTSVCGSCLWYAESS